MIEVRVNHRQSGRLTKIAPAGSSFVYGGLSDPEQGVSLTMPVQAPSYDWNYGLLPVFEMNLPEGALRARLQRDFAKSLGHFDDLDLLAITGRHQIGRIEYGAPPDVMALMPDRAPAGFQSVDEILKARRDGDLFDYLMSRYAGQSGISGVQPKVLIQDTDKFSPALTFSQDAGQGDPRKTVSLSSATHIVKLWEPSEYPELAANEYFCLRAAVRAGLDVPQIDLSETGEALIVERFDLAVIADENGPGPRQGIGRYKGFEDFCVLNGVNAADKYRGSYEAKLFRRLTDYIAPASAHEDLLKVFKLFVLNVVVRNGDAHLKNFGLLYDSLAGDVRLAPVYDIITTTAYLPKDGLALTLAGSTRWPNRAKLQRLGTAYCELSPAQISAAINQVCQAVSDSRSEMQAYFADCPTPAIGEAMAREWESGLQNTG